MDNIIMEYLSSRDENIVMIGIEILKNSGINQRELEDILKGDYSKFGGSKGRAFYHPGDKGLGFSKRPPGIYMCNDSNLMRPDPNRDDFSSYYKYLGPL